jgi:hypothetical protein
LSLSSLSSSSPSSWPEESEPGPELSTRSSSSSLLPGPELSPGAGAAPVQAGSLACSASSQLPRMSSPGSRPGAVVGGGVVPVPPTAPVQAGSLACSASSQLPEMSSTVTTVVLGSSSVVAVDDVDDVLV